MSLKGRRHFLVITSLLSVVFFVTCESTVSIGNKLSYVILLSIQVLEKLTHLAQEEL